MGAAAPTANPDPGSVPAKIRYSRPPKANARANEVGITSQEAVEFAISYAKQQRQVQEAQQGSPQHQSGRQHRLSGPEGEKHYHTFTKSQPRQLTTGARHNGLVNLRIFALNARTPCVLADSPFADVEIVADSWTKQSFSGIRALPQSLEPGFRQQALYDSVMRGMHTTGQRSHLHSLRRGPCRIKYTASVPPTNHEKYAQST